MTGQKLYQWYVEAHEDLNNTSVEEWDELTESDKLVWDYIAARVMERVR